MYLRHVLNCRLELVYGDVAYLAAYFTVRLALKHAVHLADLVAKPLVANLRVLLVNNVGELLF